MTDFLLKHGCRVRRSEAMSLLCITDKRVWRKVLEANPQMKHRLPGEGQDKYITAEIFRLLPNSSRCATGVEDEHVKPPQARP